ncbi:MAG: PEP-CTERM sorting domain-containing protein [Methylococcaceae bacterium]
MKNLFYPALLATGLLFATSANSTILDAWQLNTNGAGLASTTTNIGHLGLQSGNADITITTATVGVVAINDTFSELGGVFSINYTKENCVGACDSGLPIGLNNSLALEVVYSGLGGIVTNVSGSTYTFNFTPGVGAITLKGSLDNFATSTTLGNFSVAFPSGGDQGAFLGGILTNGTTDILGLVLNSGYALGLFRDSTGTALPLGNLFVAVHTQNTIPPGAFTVNGNQIKTTVNMDGSANILTQNVPEPNIVALLGIGLLASGFRKKFS